MKTIFFESTLELMVLPELTDENKTKVCLITDISKALKTLGPAHSPLDPEDFDELYDKEVEELGVLLDQTMNAVAFRKRMRERYGDRHTDEGVD